MRIISGKWKSRKLYSTKGMKTRPTSGRVKEAIFNIISHRLSSSVILDIFAGTGSMGFEALSRGSSEVVFIEKDIGAVKVIGKNATALDCSSAVHIIKKDVFRAIGDLAESEYIFDIIFMDPPYNTNIEKDVISSILNADIMDSQGIIVVEHDYRDIMPDKIDTINRIDTRKYGNTSVSFYARGDFYEYSNIPR